jgi:hypothetical protein
MTSALEADVAFLHIAGGAPRETPPPGVVALTSPRRSARVRSEDLLFLALGAEPPQALGDGLLAEVAQIASHAFYTTPGSVTAALREMAAAINDELLRANQSRSPGDVAQLRLAAGVLRGEDIYLAQCGNSQAILIRPGMVTRLSSDEAAARPLGLTESPFVRFHHLEAHAQDMLVLTAAEPPLWSDPSLSGLTGVEPPRAVDRLAAASAKDLSGLVIRITAPGETITAAPAPARPLPAAPRPAARPARPRAPRRAGGWQDGVRRARDAVSRAFSWIGEKTLTLIARLAPGAAEAPRPGDLPPRLLAATAVVVPLLVVVVSAAVYLRRGRIQEFQGLLGQAQAAVAAAQVKPSLGEARPDWELAYALLLQAGQYGSSADYRTLFAQVESTLDDLNLVSRMEFRPAVGGGFGSQSRITGLAATASDLYVLDEGQGTIWHTWATGRGYEVDRDFECLGSAEAPSGSMAPMDIVIQAEPGALGAEGVVAVDPQGGLLYCAPDRLPATGRLTPPDLGWGGIQAIDVFGDRLYVLDPRANAVYSFDATGGLFSGAPNLYFVDQVPDLTQAVDLAMAEDDLFLLFADARLDRCRRSQNESSGAIEVVCETGVIFVDQRPGFEGQPHNPGGVLGPMLYSPPPEPSLYFLEPLSSRIFHYSLRLAYQREYRPQSPFASPATAFTLGPPNDLFLAIGTQVYFATPLP